MKKIVSIILAIVMLLSITVVAFAENAVQGGFYNVSRKTNRVKAYPTTYGNQSFSFTKEKPIKFNNDSTKYDVFYEGSDSIKVRVSNTKAANQYLVLLVEGDELPGSSSEIYYIDQAAGNGGDLEFNVFPKTPVQDTTMTLYVTSNEQGFVAQSVTLGYTPTVEVETKSFTYGDIDGQPGVTANDALKILQYSLEQFDLSDKDLFDAANVSNPVDGDNAVNSFDALLILQKNLELIQSWNERVLN